MFFQYKPSETYEPPHGKTNNLHYAKTKTQISFAVTAKLISAFVFAKRIVQPLFYLYPTFQASSSLLCLYRSVCVGPIQKPHCWFSHEAAHIPVLGVQYNNCFATFDCFTKRMASKRTFKIEIPSNQIFVRNTLT